ncbi:Bgr_08870 family protein [Bartonella sp. B23]
MKKTKKLEMELPQEGRFISSEFPILRENLIKIDQAIATIDEKVDDKASLHHMHKISDVTGLEMALKEKMPAEKSFALSELADVEGAKDAANNYVLYKSSNNNFTFGSAKSLLGAHQHKTEDIVGLETRLSSFARSDDVYDKTESNSRFLEKTRGVFYGLNVDGAKLTLTTGSGDYDVNDFDSWFIGLPDIVFTINDNGYLTLTI